MDKAAVRSKTVVLLLLIHCFMHLILFVGVLSWSMFCYASLCVCSSFAIILMMKERELVALLHLSCGSSRCRELFCRLGL